MSGVTITDVKVVGLCSKHRSSNDEVPRYKDGKMVPDKDIHCIAEALGDKP